MGSDPEIATSHALTEESADECQKAPDDAVRDSRPGCRMRGPPHKQRPLREQDLAPGGSSPGSDLGDGNGARCKRPVGLADPVSKQFGFSKINPGL